MSYGKAHFYLRPHCDYDFGIELAKRVADEGDISQTAARRFQGRKRKDITSYSPHTTLDVQSGESVDFLQAAIIESKQETFGMRGKFGTSALVAPKIEPAELGAFLTDLFSELHSAQLFRVPRTTWITEPDEVERFERLATHPVRGLTALPSPRPRPGKPKLNPAAKGPPPHAHSHEQDQLAPRKINSRLGGGLRLSPVGEVRPDSPGSPGSSPMTVTSPRPSPSHAGRCWPGS